MNIVSTETNTAVKHSSKQHFLQLFYWFLGTWRRLPGPDTQNEMRNRHRCTMVGRVRQDDAAALSTKSESLIRQKRWSVHSQERRKLSPTVKGRWADLWGSRANNEELWATSSKTNVKRNEDVFLLCQLWQAICCAQVKRGKQLCGREPPSSAILDSWKHEQTMLSQVRPTGLYCLVEMVHVSLKSPWGDKATKREDQRQWQLKTVSMTLPFIIFSCHYHRGNTGTKKVQERTSHNSISRQKHH